jgi:hypothetical protein
VENDSLSMQGKGSENFGITIYKKGLSVMASDFTVSVGDAMPILSQNDVSFDGFITGENQSVLGGTLAFIWSQEHTNKEVIGATITPSGYTSNSYELNYVKGNFTVNAKTFSGTPYLVSGINNGGIGANLWYRSDITLTLDASVCGGFNYIRISTDRGNYLE